jgi:hypothetical protein
MQKFKLKGCECPDDDCGNKAYEGLKRVYELALHQALTRLQTGETLMSPIGEALYCVHWIGSEVLFQEKLDSFRETIGEDLINRIVEKAKEELQKDGVSRDAKLH